MKIQHIETKTDSGKIPLTIFLGDRILVSRDSAPPDLQDQVRSRSTWLHSMPSLLFVLPGEHVSTYHAVIEFCADKCTLRDLGSSNGTKLNANACEPYAAYELKQGDAVCFAGQECSVEIVAPFSDLTCQSDGVRLSAVNRDLAQCIDAELKIERNMWLRQQTYLCGTCREEVIAGPRACPKCLQHMRAETFCLKPLTTIEFGLNLLNIGVRWDRCFHDCRIESTGQQVFVEMRAVHERDLPQTDLESAACQMLHLRHAGLFRLFAWFDRPAPGWKYGKSHVRVYEHSEAANLAAITRSGPIACSAATEIVLAATNTALYALENNCPQFADSLDLGQIWLVPATAGGFGLKLDCHRQDLFSWSGSGYAESVRKPLMSAAIVITATRFKGKVMQDHSRVLSAAIILYRLIAGRMPEFPENELDFDLWKDWCIQELPANVDISPPVADLILSCLGRDTVRMPMDLKEFAERLSSASRHA